MQNSQHLVKKFRSSLFCTRAIFFLSLTLSSCQSSPVKGDIQTPISQTEPESVSIQPQEYKAVKTLLAIAEAQEAGYFQGSRFAASLAQLDIAIPEGAYEFSITKSNQFEWVAIATTANHRLKSYGIAGNILFGDTASFNSQLCEGKKVGKPQVSLTIIGEILECGHDSKPISQSPFLKSSQ